MVTPQNGESLGVIKSVSKFAGTLAGTAVITGKRIIGQAKLPSEGSSDKPKKKNIPAQTKRKKKVIRKTEAKAPKIKNKKAVKRKVKRKSAGSSGKGGTSKKKPAGSPAKKKKIATPKKKTTRRKTKKTAKNEVSGHSQNGLTSETSVVMNTPTEKQKPQVQQSLVFLYGHGLYRQDDYQDRARQYLERDSYFT